MRFGRARATARTTVPRPEGSSCGPRPEAARTTAPVSPRSPAEGAMTTLCGRCPAQGRPLLTEQGRARQAARGAGSPGAGKHVETREGCCRPRLGAEPPVSAPTGAVTRARAPPSRWVERAIWACALGLFSACALCQARGAVGVARVGVRGLRPVASFQFAFQPGLGRRWGELAAGRRGVGEPACGAGLGGAEREGFEPSMGREPHTRLAGECLQPLGHLSRRSRW